MIKLNPQATFPSKVVVHQGADGADPAVATFTFRVLTNRQLVAFYAVIGAGQYSRMRRLWERARLLLRLRRWPNLADALDIIVAGWDGFDLPYSRAAMVQLLQAFPGVGLSIVAKYSEDRLEARIKN